MTCWATGVMMRPESSIVKLGEIASDKRSGDCCIRSWDLGFKLPFGPQIGKGVSAASCTRHVLENAAGSQAAIACEAQPNPAAGGPRF